MDLTTTISDFDEVFSENWNDIPEAFLIAESLADVEEDCDIGRGHYEIRLEDERDRLTFSLSLLQKWRHRCFMCRLSCVLTSCL